MSSVSAQPEYLIRTDRDARSIVQAAKVGARHPEINRVKRDYGVFREVEGTGRYDQRHLRIFAESGEDQRVVYAHGGKSGAGAATYTEASAAGVKRVLRRLRPQEALELDVLDGEIADLQRQLRVTRDRRVEVVRRAWTAAHVVRLQEVEALMTEEGGA